MMQDVKSLFLEAFGQLEPSKSNRHMQRRLRKRQQHARIILLRMALVILLVMLYASQLLAQESQPKYRFEQPSDEMDFTLQPVPDIPSNIPPPPVDDFGDAPPGLYGFGTPPPIDGLESDEDDDRVIDPFFSTTTIIAPDAAPEEVVEEEVETFVAVPEELETAKPKPKKHRYYKPPHRFKSVLLPREIYHRQHSFDNKHLPFAYYQQDRQRLLKEAIMLDDVTMLRALHANGADLEQAVILKDGKTSSLLSFAVQHQKVDATRWLLMYRADPNQMDEYGIAPLHYAAYSGNHELVELLLHYGADASLTDARGADPMLYAQHGKNPQLVQLMIR